MKLGLSGCLVLTRHRMRIAANCPAFHLCWLSVCLLPVSIIPRYAPDVGFLRLCVLFHCMHYSVKYY